VLITHLELPRCNTACATATGGGSIITSGGYTLALLLILSFVLSAPAEEVPPEVMIVTAKRLPIDSSRFSGSLSVITAEQIARKQYQVLGDALRELPGLYAPSSGGIGAQTSVFIRGAESDHVLILIDGVEVSDPAAGNLYEFSQFSLNGVERIEVLRGNHSAEFGSEAIGGIVNIITATPNEDKIAARVETGSFERRSATVDIAAIHQSLDFSLSGRYFETDGESFTPARLRRLDSCAVKTNERDGYRNSNIKFNAGLSLIPETHTELRMKSEYSQVDLEYDQGSCENLDSEQSSYTKRTTLSLSGDYLDRLWSPTWRMDYYERNSRDTASPRSEGERLKFVWHNIVRAQQNLDMAFGLETELEQASTDNDFDASARTNAFYGEVHYTVSPNWHLNGGWRNDDADDFASERSYQFGAVWHANLNTRLHINYATAFKAPSLLDRFRDFPAFNFSANPNLRPETSRSWEAGLEQNWLRWRYGITYFNSEIDDLIDYIFNPADFSSTLVNRSETEIEGLESFVSYQPNQTFALRLDYTLTSAHDQSHQRLLRRPLRQAVLAFDYQPDEGILSDWDFDLSLNYTGRRDDTNRVSFARIHKGGYTVANLRLSYQINEHLQLYGSINNLLDKSYEAVDGFSGSGLDAHVGLSFR